MRAGAAQVVLQGVIDCDIGFGDGAFVALFPLFRAAFPVTERDLACDAGGFGQEGEVVILRQG